MNPILLNFPDHFSTERLDLRAPRAGDGSELHAAVCETWDELTPWLPWARKLPTAEECEELMRDAVAKWQRREDLWLLAFVKGTGQLVASSGLSRIDWTVPRFEVGYWVRKSFAGQGYVTEAVRGIVGYAVRELGAKRVQLHIDVRNDRSRRVAERAGFEFEARMPRMLRANDGSLADIDYYRYLPPLPEG
ncbi:MAG TPA: GNAT family N-acetyltransferase [Pseudomonadota bacterium]|nr:GNAT family N-acetyltransferase [Pseudomonadota bacterium]